MIRGVVFFHTISYPQGKTEMILLAEYVREKIMFARINGRDLKWFKHVERMMEVKLTNRV